MLSDLKNKNENISLINLIVKSDKIIPPSTQDFAHVSFMRYFVLVLRARLLLVLFDLDLKVNFSVSM